MNKARIMNDKIFRRGIYRRETQEAKISKAVRKQIIEEIMKKHRYIFRSLRACLTCSLRKLYAL